VKPVGDVLSLCATVSFTGSDEDGGDQRTSQRAERAIRRSEQSDRAPVRARNPYSNCAARAPGIPCSISRA
jgi:hypothetical protein